jgi:PAS domain S-box-containing protein
MNSNTASASAAAAAVSEPQASTTAEDNINTTLEIEDDINAIVKESIELRRKADILSSVPDLIVVFDAVGHICYASQSTLDLFGLAKASDIEGRSFWDMVTSESRARIVAAFEDALAVELKDGCDSTPFACGEILPVHLVTRDEQGRQEVHMASFKGTACINGNKPECVCSLRLVANDTSDVVVSDYEDGKAKRNAGLLKRAAAPGNAAGAKRIRIDDASLNQISDGSVSK